MGSYIIWVPNVSPLILLISMYFAFDDNIAISSLFGDVI